MNLSIQRETLLEPLQMVIGVVEKRQTLPILSNILLKANGSQLSLTATDLEVELISKITLSSPVSSSIEFTIPAHKLLDICRTLPSEATVDLQKNNEQLIVKSGRSRFILSTLPAENFPCFENNQGTFNYTIPQKHLNALLHRTHFAMGQQDVRYYLNGMLIETQKNQLRTVATDGHRFAMNMATITTTSPGMSQAIIPRKGVLELIRLLKGENESIDVTMGENHIQITTPTFTFTSKLIDGRFPDYQQVLPKEEGKTIIVDRDELKEALLRVSILSNEKFRTILMKLSKNTLHISANNTDQEEAEEVVSIEYDKEDIEIAFNVAYLLDVLNTLLPGKIKMTFIAPKHRMLVEEHGEHESIFLVMPLQI